MLGNQMFNSVLGFEEDLNRLKGWTLCTPLVKPVRGGRRTTRVRARSPRRVGVAWRGTARRAAAGRAVRVHGAAERDVTCKCSAVRCDVMC